MAAGLAAAIAEPAASGAQSLHKQRAAARLTRADASSARVHEPSIAAAVRGFAGMEARAAAADARRAAAELGRQREAAAAAAAETAARRDAALALVSRQDMHLRTAAAAAAMGAQRRLRAFGWDPWWRLVRVSREQLRRAAAHAVSTRLRRTLREWRSAASAAAAAHAAKAEVTLSILSRSLTRAAWTHWRRAAAIGLHKTRWLVARSRVRARRAALNAWRGAAISAIRWRFDAASAASRHCCTVRLRRAWLAWQRSLPGLVLERRQAAESDARRQRMWTVAMGLLNGGTGPATGSQGQAQPHVVTACDSP